MEAFFIVCFVFGALFTVLSVVLGFAGSAMHGMHGGDGAHAGHAGHDVAVAHGGHADGHGHELAHHGNGGHHGLPLFNASSLLAFLTWFGAGGYLLLRFASAPAIVAVGGGALAGGAGSVLIALSLARVLAGERVMNRADYRLEGTLARVTVSIPANGAGEIVFTKAGTRRGEAARSLTGRPIPRETEVAVIEYERGVALVQPWDELVGRDGMEQVERSTPPAGGA